MIKLGTSICLVIFLLSSLLLEWFTIPQPIVVKLINH